MAKQIVQQTRSFDADNDTTFAIRDKEEANDYRYFPEPDLTPFQLTDTFIAGIQTAMPALPAELYKKYVSLGLSEYDAAQLSEEKSKAAYFEKVSAHSQNYKAIANWMNGPLQQTVNEQQVNFAGLKLAPATLAALIKLIDDGKVNFSIASLKILPELIKDAAADPLQVATRLNLLQVSGTGEIEGWTDEVLRKFPDKVKDYKKGKKGLIGLFVGEMKKLSKGTADPKIATQILEEKLK